MTHTCIILPRECRGGGDTCIEKDSTSVVRLFYLQNWLFKREIIPDGLAKSGDPCDKQNSKVKAAWQKGHRGMGISEEGRNGWNSALTPSQRANQISRGLTALAGRRWSSQVSCVWKSCLQKPHMPHTWTGRAGSRSVLDWSRPSQGSGGSGWCAGLSSGKLTARVRRPWALQQAVAVPDWPSRVWERSWGFQELWVNLDWQPERKWRPDYMQQRAKFCQLSERS